MGIRQKVNVLFWTIIVLFILAFTSSLPILPTTHSGDKLKGYVKQNWWIDLDCQGSVAIQAASSHPFIFQSRSTGIEYPGIQTPVPLDYDHDTYFYLDKQFDCGTWQLIEGSDVNVKLTSDTSIDVTSYATRRKLLTNSIIAVSTAFSLWGIGFGVINYVYSKEASKNKSDVTEEESTT